LAGQEQEASSQGEGTRVDVLGLKGKYSEKDLETAILLEMEAFILELGVGFAFVARVSHATAAEGTPSEELHAAAELARNRLETSSPD